MTDQEAFDRGVVGTIIQGFVYRHNHVDHNIEVGNGTPCRCWRGHLCAEPVGEYIRGWPVDGSGFPVKISGDIASKCVPANDRSCGLDDFRHRMSSVALDLVLDDSCCWMELAE